MAANSELSASTSTPSLASPEQKPVTGCVHTQLLHAFLEAAEVVAPDEDVIDDLLADLHEAAVVLQDDDANALEVVVPEQEAGDGDAELEFESEHDPLQPYLLEGSCTSCLSHVAVS